MIEWSQNHLDRRRVPASLRIQDYRITRGRFGPCQRSKKSWRRCHQNFGVEVILVGMTSRVGPKGQVVIPKNMRDQLGISPGDEVDFALDGSAVRVELVREMTSLRGSLAGRGLVSELEADHRTERER